MVFKKRRSRDIGLWIRAAYLALNKADFPLTKFIESRSQRERFHWDGKRISDHWTDEDWQSFDREISRRMDRGDERGVVIVSCAMIEDRLRWVIEGRFIRDLSQSKKAYLFEDNGPLATFEARIAVAHALGVIPENMRDILKLIASIRNKFAHDFRDVSFTTPKIVNMCAQFSQFDERDIPQDVVGDPIKRYAWHCIVLMTTLLTLGQFYYADPEPPPSPDK